MEISMCTRARSLQLPCECAAVPDRGPRTLRALALSLVTLSVGCAGAMSPAAAQLGASPDSPPQANQSSSTAEAPADPASSGGDATADPPPINPTPADAVAQLAASEMEFDFPAGASEKKTKASAEDARLLAETAVVYPDDPALTAGVLAKWINCDIVLLYLTAARARSHASRAEADANTALIEARSAQRDWLEKYKAHSIADYVVRWEPEVRMPPYTPVEASPGIRPPERNPPETEQVRPLDVEETVRELGRLMSWSDILKAWPGGCPAPTPQK